MACSKDFFLFQHEFYMMWVDVNIYCASYIFMFTVLFYRLGQAPPPIPSPDQEEKFIVFKSNLLELLQVCHQYPHHVRADAVLVKTVGTLAIFRQTCPECHFTRTWASQPYLNNQLPAGNLLLSASILVCGALPSQTLRVFKTMNIACISRITFTKHQHDYVIPTVFSYWKEKQQENIGALAAMQGGVHLAGDGRCDSPGHCAKFGAYSVIEQRINKILDIQVVQVSIAVH